MNSLKSTPCRAIQVTQKEGNFQKIVYSSDYGESIFYNYPENNSYVYGDFNEVFHKKLLFGLIGSIGFKGFFADYFSYSANVRYEYDFTNPDKINYYNNIDTNVHNFRIGLEFGLQYNFAINDRFNKRRIKI